MMVFISNVKKNYMFRPTAAIFRFLTTFFLKEFYIICLNRVVMLRSHHHFTSSVKLNLKSLPRTNIS